MLSSASSLDPKCAKAFNHPVVNQYFDNSKSLLLFPSRTFITWMRRDARGVVGKRLAKENIYALEDSMPSTSIIELITIIEGYLCRWN